MFSCRACTKRCIQALIGDSAISYLPSQASLIRPHAHRLFTSTATNQAIVENDETNYRPLDQEEGNSQSRVTGSSERQQWLKSRGVTPADKKPAKPDPREDAHFFKKVKQLQDPLNLAQFVRSKLKNDDFETALLYVRAASKNVQCVVSWNHLIEWQLSKGKMNAAIKTYNEMKKRAQFPDAQTYTIIFKGCSEHPYIKEGLQKGLLIYTSMLAEKARIKPNTIHTNAMLRLCSRAGDQDTLLGIAGQMDSTGLNAPNNLTFTTILNAFRMNAIGDPAMDQDQLKRTRRTAIQNARRMWGDIYVRWRKGDIFIDEELVCAMGRVLLLGDAQDLDDILSLVQQAMDIRRQLPRMDTKSRQKIEPSLQGKPVPKESQENTLTTNDTNQTETTAQPSALIASSPDNVFSISTYEATQLAKSIAHATPGQNTISLVLDALLKLNVKEAATKYWDIFTKTKNIIPDADNYHAYLRILRVFRSGGQASELVQSIPPHLISEKICRLAMSACLRDKNNHRTFSNAGKILDIMQMHLRVPDIRALIDYLEIAVTSPPHTTAEGGKPTAYAQGQQILRALERLNPSYLNVRALLMYGNPTDAKEDKYYNSDEFRASVRLLVRRLIAAYDILMNKGLVTPEMYGKLTGQRGKLAAFVARSNQALNPNFKKETKLEKSELPELSQEQEQEQEQNKTGYFDVPKSRRASSGELKAARKMGYVSQSAVRGYLGRNQNAAP
ncbi:hypothetical protein ACMFMG_004543 [Clarireedia jacksonii]